MQQTETFKNGERGNHLLQVRLTKTQHERLKALATASGFATVSDYVRINLLNPSIEEKLNRIMSLLSEKNENEIINM